MMTDAQRCHADTAWQAFGPGGRKTNDVPEFGPDPSYPEFRNLVFREHRAFF